MQGAIQVLGFMHVCDTITFESFDVENSSLVCRDMKVIGSGSRSQNPCINSVTYVPTFDCKFVNYEIVFQPKADHWQTRFLLLWPWPRPDDLNIRTWRKDSEDVPAYQQEHSEQAQNTSETSPADRRGGLSSKAKRAQWQGERVPLVVKGKGKGKGKHVFV